VNQPVSTMAGCLGWRALLAFFYLGNSLAQDGFGLAEKGVAIAYPGLPAYYRPALISDQLKSRAAELRVIQPSSEELLPADGQLSKSFQLPPLKRSASANVRQLGRQLPWQLGKRSPPGFLIPWKLGKRSGLDVVGSRAKKSGEPGTNDANYVWNNILRSPQGFRFHDGFGSFRHSARYKRAWDMKQELNSIPLLGKRQENALAQLMLPSDVPLTRSKQTATERSAVFQPM